jgi:hypothetical protein
VADNEKDEEFLRVKRSEADPGRLVRAGKTARKELGDGTLIAGPTAQRPANIVEFLEPWDDPDTGRHYDVGDYERIQDDKVREELIAEKKARYPVKPGNQ